ncbi:MAG: hypothetical protein AAF518_14380 [Spirochaetota bacterium]
MASFKFEYNLQSAGWAEAIVTNNDGSISMVASYLHDSLYNLANATIVLLNGADSAKVVFMDEPGEHQLILQKVEQEIAFEVRWFQDWESWDMHPADKYEVVLQGRTTLKRLAGEFFSVLEMIYETYSLKEYKELWIEHKFPIDPFNRLKNLWKTELR